MAEPIADCTDAHGHLLWVRPALGPGTTAVNMVLACMALGLVRETDKEKSNCNTV